MEVLPQVSTVPDEQGISLTVPWQESIPVAAEQTGWL
jgi:hypothetical protein